MSQSFERYATGAKWESIVGYSRAVRAGQTIEVSGTVAVRDGNVVGENDPYLQTQCILDIINEALTHFGAGAGHIIRTRIFVTDIKAQWRAVGKAHQEFFGENRPVTTMVEVAALVSPEYLVEIEATAMLPA